MKHIKIFFSTIKENLIAFFAFLIIWQISSLFFQDFIVPSPILIFNNFETLITDSLLNNLEITIFRILTGFSIAFIIGSIIGFLSNLFRIRESVNTVLILFQVLPGTVLGIIYLLIFGQGNAVPVAMIITLTTPLIAINTGNSLLNINQELEDVVYSLGGTYWDAIRSVHLPALVPVLRSNGTLGLGFALKIVILGEFIASETGLGYLLNVSKIYFNMRSVFFYLLLIIIIMLIFQIIINLIFVIFFEKYLFQTNIQ
ncbi:MAG: ABC transporter permease subunit [Candidatus Marinimicrobia bacterium]|nr:ABC transporter permease subunit [Candidatus Neomarinimicrobiota bacterium]